MNFPRKVLIFASGTRVFNILELGMAMVITPNKEDYFKGDGHEIMHQLPDKSLDVVLCDVLYGITQNKWDCYVAALLEGRNFIASDKNEVSN